MGEFVTDLDDSYITEDHVDVPPPPKRPLACPPQRAMVLLPQRAHASSVVEVQVSGVQPAVTQTTTGFGFPVSVPCDNTPPASPSQARRASSRPVRRGSEKPRTRPGHPNHHTRIPASPARSEVFHSITATPGLDERSFEELRLECYSMSLAITGTIPPPVPPGFDETTRGRHSAEHIRVFPPLFDPFVTPRDGTEDGLAECCDHAMSNATISSDFTFSPGTTLLPPPSVNASQ